jgi:hypothetical protein
MESDDLHLTIRLAGPGDAGTLRRLAQLDSARPLTGYVLLAERDGEPVAALALETGAVTADPFRPTAEAVRRLELRRYELVRQGSDAGPVHFAFRHPSPCPAR